ncbi:MAG: mechanosensitive ion channel family protein [Leptolyngbyaceae cyanobacterium SL_1_1]|nr:mechanosensitive ion channel family protein [Leptolyngbyaceae cyanobacterium RM1_1_2]NJO10762.1 mechanosensitive ion channel family protein [Leptolyngbyaceae cyanobacterium SL_1_1]
MLSEFLKTEILNNQVSDYLLAIAILLGGVLVINLIKSLFLSRLKRWSNRTATDLDDRLVILIERPVMRLCYVGTFYVSVHNLSLHPILAQAVEVICIILVTVLGIQLLGSLVEYSIRIYWITRNRDAALEQTLHALVPAVKVVVWAVGIVFLLDNLGFDISAVVAGLGIGGVAIALASQGVLQDLFSYFAILFDSPFELGDFIIVGDLVGTVEHIGIKTTHLRSLGGEQLIIANTDLTSSRIQNFKRMARRRIVFKLSVTYATGAECLTEIPEIVQDIIQNIENVSFDRAHFSHYGDFSLDFEVVYFVESSDYNVYMDAQQQIYLKIKSAFTARAIEFAYPTQLVHLNQLQTQPANHPRHNGHAPVQATES